MNSFLKAVKDWLLPQGTITQEQPALPRRTLREIEDEIKGLRNALDIRNEQQRVRERSRTEAMIIEHRIVELMEEKKRILEEIE